MKNVFFTFYIVIWNDIPFECSLTSPTDEVWQKANMLCFFFLLATLNLPVILSAVSSHRKSNIINPLRKLYFYGGTLISRSLMRADQFFRNKMCEVSLFFPQSLGRAILIGDLVGPLPTLSKRVPWFGEKPDFFMEVGKGAATYEFDIFKLISLPLSFPRRTTVTLRSHSSHTPVTLQSHSSLSQRVDKERTRRRQQSF